MTDTCATSGKAVELREAFDRARAFPFASTVAEALGNLLAIRVAGDPYAIRVGEIAGLTRGRKIVPLPGPLPELVGLASIRGGIVPVYSLAALLGYPQENAPALWLVLCGAGDTVGLALSDFEGSLRVPANQIHEAAAAGVAREHVQHIVRARGLIRAVISVSHLLESVRARCQTNDSPKER